MNYCGRRARYMKVKVIHLHFSKSKNLFTKIHIPMAVSYMHRTNCFWNSDPKTICVSYVTSRSSIHAGSMFLIVYDGQKLRIDIFKIQTDLRFCDCFLNWSFSRVDLPPLITFFKSILEFRNEMEKRIYFFATVRYELRAAASAHFSVRVWD